MIITLRIEIIEEIDLMNELTLNMSMRTIKDQLIEVTLIITETTTII